jgi:hypothetical protein
MYYLRLIVVVVAVQWPRKCMSMTNTAKSMKSGIFWLGVGVIQGKI